MNDILGATCVLTVTYGSRFQFLEQTIDAAFATGAGSVLVVDNCADDACRAGLARLQERYGTQLEVLSLPDNTGSAGGFKAGLAYILERRQFEYVWLLDDDNVPEPDALGTLVACYRTLVQRHSHDRLALHSLRDRINMLERIAAGLPLDLVLPRRSSFQKLHVLGELAKFHARLAGLRRSPPDNKDECIVIPYAPFGGLFFHRDLLARIGLPDERLFLYVDDLIFTYSLTSHGGVIYLIPASRVKDIDLTWHEKAVIPRVLMSDSDLRVYYRVRNRAYFDRYYWADNRPMYYLNMVFYCAGMAWLAALRGRWARFRLICRAIRDGQRGQLGTRDDLLTSFSS